MNEIDELLDEVRKRPGLYIGKKSLDRLTNFITGYCHYAYKKEGKMLNCLPGFQGFIEDKYDIYSHHWSQIIEFYSVYEADAFDRFYELLDEFREKQKEFDSSENDILKLTDSNISCMDIVKTRVKNIKLYYRNILIKCPFY